MNSSMLPESEILSPTAIELNILLEDEKTKRRKPASETKVKKSTRFDPARDLPDLSGRVAVVTGGK